jgi:prevent-host-death family protein
MATIVNMHEAKSTLSKLVEKVAAGEEVVIAKAGKPVARLVKYDREPRKLGGW